MQLPKVINNISERAVDDLMVKMTSGSKLSIAAASFSIYAYEVLKAELENVDELRFIFTSPTFITKKILCVCMLRSPPEFTKAKCFNIFTRLVECFYGSFVKIALYLCIE